MNPASQLWVELVGEIIVARIRGIPTEELIGECQRRVIALQADTGCKRVLYDALELERPPIEIVLTQQSFSSELKESTLAWPSSCQTRPSRFLHGWPLETCTTASFTMTSPQPFCG